MSVTQKGESEKVQIDWALIEKYLVDVNLSGKDKQEQTSNHETQQLQVGTSSSLKLMMSDTICPIGFIFACPYHLSNRHSQLATHLMEFSCLLLFLYTHILGS
jgi:hypothetical protein